MTAENPGWLTPEQLAELNRIMEPIEQEKTDPAPASCQWCGAVHRKGSPCT